MKSVLSNEVMNPPLPARGQAVAYKMPGLRCEMEGQDDLWVVDQVEM